MEKSILQMLPLLEFSFHKTESLVNSHAGSERLFFVLTCTGSCSHVINHGDKGDHSSPTSLYHPINPEEQHHVSRGEDGQDLKEGIDSPPLV